MPQPLFAWGEIVFYSDGRVPWTQHDAVAFMHRTEDIYLSVKNAKSLTLVRRRALRLVK